MYPVITVLLAVLGGASSGPSYSEASLGAEPGSGSSQPWSELVSSLACAPDITERLERWGASSETFRAPSAADGSDRYRIATRHLGVWITIDVGRTGRVRLFRNDATSGIEVALGTNCEVSERALAGIPITEEPQFTDRDLEVLLSKHDALVVYLWSPHLPLSVEGYAEIRAATSAAGVGLAAVVDPSADSTYVREVGDVEAIPLEARRRLASVELLFRDLAVHAPAIVLFAGGRARPVLPGYRGRDAYVDYLHVETRSTKMRGR